jgi:prolyl-tRNA synthetase
MYTILKRVNQEIKQRQALPLKIYQICGSVHLVVLLKEDLE